MVKCSPKLRSRTTDSSERFRNQHFKSSISFLFTHKFENYQLNKNDRNLRSHLRKLLPKLFYFFWVDQYENVTGTHALLSSKGMLFKGIDLELMQLEES